MLLVFFLKGIVVGIVIAVPVGPVGVMCIRRTVFEGRLAGLVSGLGAATADAIFGVIAGFGPRLSGSILVDKAHGIGTTRFGTFGDGPDTRGQLPCCTRIAYFISCWHMPWPDFER